MSITAIFEIRLNPSTLSEAADVIAHAVRDTRAAELPGLLAGPPQLVRAVSGDAAS
jgi:hypothetical protein